MAAAWILIGAVLSGWAFWRRWSMTQRGGRRRRRPPDSALSAEMAAGADPGSHLAVDPREAAMSVLTEPLALEEAGRRGAAVQPVKHWRLGTIFGLGIGLIFAGVLLLIFPPAPVPAEVADPGSAASRPAVITAPAAPATGQGPAGSSLPGGGAGSVAPAPIQPSVPAPSLGSPAVEFVIADGELPRTVVARLQAAGLISDEQAFIERLVQRQLDTRIHSGKFQLYHGMSIDEIITVLTGGAG